MSEAETWHSRGLRSNGLVNHWTWVCVSGEAMRVRYAWWDIQGMCNAAQHVMGSAVGVGGDAARHIGGVGRLVRWRSMVMSLTLPLWLPRSGSMVW